MEDLPGIGPELARRLWDAVGARGLAGLRDDPYRFIGRVRGIGFRRADRIALHLGVDPASPLRTRAALLHALEQAERAGHVHAPLPWLARAVWRLTGAPPDRIARAVVELAAEGRVACEGRAVYAPPLLRAERRAARGLARLAAAPPRMRDASLSVLGRISAGAGLDDAQAAALEGLRASNLQVITGPPGTGKTTVVRALARWAQRERLAMALAAPTGRAARRLSEVAQQPAFTLHRLLQLNDTDRPRVLPADLVVVDEASMVDLPLLSSLVASIKPDAVLVLVGDEDQLPSVGPGNVLADVIRSGVARVARLSRIFRQGPGSGIVRAADRIRQGLDPLVPEVEPDLVFEAHESAPATVRALLAHAAREPSAQVLTPMNRGVAGVHELNVVLRAQLNPSAEPAAAARGLATGDRVIHCVNDYARNLYNGDIGHIALIEGAEVTAVFGTRTERFQGRALAQLAPAFALSIHKSQGSEYDTVIVPVVHDHAYLLRRNLLYTAITRARRRAILLGSPAALQAALANDRSDSRFSRLSARLRLAPTPRVHTSAPKRTASSAHPPARLS